jgi:ATPase subunit of ABC transporter with duplicated ATPase domains
MTDAITQTQLTSLDETDYYASAWQAALSRNTRQVAGWGGRGTARKTWQPKDIVVDSVNLAYVGSAQGGHRTLLEDATLKLLSGRVYALIGRSGSGKSSLLKRIQAKSVPGLSAHVSILYIPQDCTSGDFELTPVDYLQREYAAYQKTSSAAMQSEMGDLEARLEDLDVNTDQEEIERLVQQISDLEDALNPSESLVKDIQEALTFVGCDDSLWDKHMSTLSEGQRKRVILSVITICRCDLLLLDEPTNHLDVFGLMQLRRMLDDLEKRQTTVLMVSHDVDLINDVATDVIDLRSQSLYYTAGNYSYYCLANRQDSLALLRKKVAQDKKRDAMLSTLDHLKKQAAPKRGGGKKKAQRIDSHKKKMDRLEDIELDGGVLRGLTSQEILKMTENYVRPPPDKAVQFDFEPVKSRWHESLIVAYDVGHGYMQDNASDNGANKKEKPIETNNILVKKEGYLFDSVDFCVEEGKVYCIIGESGSGKSTLLRILAKEETPLEGKVSHATGSDCLLFSQTKVQEMISEAVEGGHFTGLDLLIHCYPKHSEQDLRGQLTSFGLSPSQASTDLRYLSGGEQRRLYFAKTMLNDPQVLLLDQPTSNLDVESVEALIDGLKGWKGTIVMISHDSNFIRSLDAQCYALVAEHGKLMRVEGGIDAYLRAVDY